MRFFRLRQGFAGLVRRSPAPLARGAEWLYVFGCTWFVIGLFLDGWAHNHVPELESFFTPWHAVFYAGYLFMALVLGTMWVMTNREGIPAGYREAMVGVFIFLAGGVGDMLWHEAFGIEKDIEALFSPTHLVLALGTILMLSAPWLAVVRSDKAPQTLAAQLPAILSLTYSASAIAFLTQFHHWSDFRLLNPPPLRQYWEMQQSISMGGYLWHVAILMCAVLMLVRFLPPRLGALGILFAVSTFGMAVMRMETMAEAFPIVCCAYVVGFFADLWLAQVSPIDKHLAGFRWFTAGVPAALIALLHGYAIPLHGTWWSIHLWTGAVAIAAGVGVLVGLVAVPPAKN